MAPMLSKYVAAYFLHSYTSSHGLVADMMAALGLFWKDEPKQKMGQFWRNFTDWIAEEE